MKTLEQRIAEDGITLVASPRENAPLPGPAMDWWNVQLRMGGKRMRVTFGMGKGSGGEKPSPALVLADLLTEVTDESYQDWCGEFGYNPESREHRHTWHLITVYTGRLREFLGDKFDEYVNETERY